MEQIKNISAERKNHSQKSEAYLEERIGVERVVHNNKSEDKQEVYIRECDEVMDVAWEIATANITVTNRG